MTSPLKTLTLVFALAVAAPVAWAGPAKDGTEVALAAMGETDVIHGQDTPLLLKVNVFNELKAVTIGSKGKPLANAVRFEVKDAKGKEAGLAVRPLAETAENKTAVDLGKGRASLHFGADPASLAALPEGDYTVQAFVKDASSAPVTVRLKKTAPANDGVVGLFYRLDRQYDALLKHSERMIQKTPNDAAGHILQGDALAGLGRGRDALAPYNKAMELHKSQSQGKPLVEEPLYVIRRINEILEKE